MLLMLSLKCFSTIPHETNQIVKITDSNKCRRKGEFNKKRDSKQVLGAMYRVRKAPRPKKQNQSKGKNNGYKLSAS